MHKTSYWSSKKDFAIDNQVINQQPNLYTKLYTDIMERDLLHIVDLLTCSSIYISNLISSNGKRFGITSLC